MSVVAAAAAAAIDVEGLSTGGYSAPGNPVMAAAAPEGLVGLLSSNAPLALGDGVGQAARLDMGPIDMDALQVRTRRASCCLATSHPRGRGRQL